MGASQEQPAIEPVIVADHLARAADQMATRDVDGLLVFRGSNILAFCGVPLAPSDRLVCGLVNRDRRIAFVVPEFEADACRGLPPGSEVITWREDADPYQAVAAAARGLGIASGNISLDGFTWLDAESRLSGAMNGAKLRRDTDIIDSVRVIKSANEIKAIRTACSDTGRIFPLVNDCLRPSISEEGLRDEVLGRLANGSFKAVGDLIQGGENAAVPHKPTGSRLFREGDAVIVDFAAANRGYLGDMTRTFAVGEPADEIKKAYAVVREAQKAAIDAIRPGMTCEAVDASARRVIESAGLGDYFIHRLGHGIGLDIHEPPFLVQGNATPLEAGMCMTVEPGVYVPGRFGIRIEDVVVVTPEGSDLLSSDVPTDFSEWFESTRTA
ncbi:MAG: Xaa-Pro peptidase family protein [Planctomycetota bacterium]|nr:Xaa-Pro peptidase family protein [Planctomycetota bacterium]MCZ6698877.1 Xaa-Pro peptidase family protein [Planctomycetota bacterium]